MIRLNAVNFISAILFVVVAGYFFGFGVQLNLSCGINSREKEWSGLFLSYPLILLPFVIYNYYKLKKIPALFKSTISAFIFQYYFYLFFYYVYTFAVFIVGLIQVER